MRLQDLAIVTNTPLDTDVVLLEKFKAHDRIQWDPKTDLYSYKVSFSKSCSVIHFSFSYETQSTNTLFGIKQP